MVLFKNYGTNNNYGVRSPAVVGGVVIVCSADQDLEQRERRQRPDSCMGMFEDVYWLRV